MKLEHYLTRQMQQLRMRGNKVRRARATYTEQLHQARSVRSSLADAPEPVTLDLFDRFVITPFGEGTIPLQLSTSFLYFAALHPLEAVTQAQFIEDFYQNACTYIAVNQTV